MNETDLNLYNAIIDSFEPMPAIPALNKTDYESMKYSAIVSIAISLKRIADMRFEEQLYKEEMRRG